MNTEKFLEYIANPESLNLTSLKEIQKLVQLFPYSQNIQLLYLFNLSITQDIRFGEQLQKTATYAADRRLLKKQILELSALPVSEESQIEPQTEFEAVESENKLKIQAENEPEKRQDAKEESEIPIIPSSLNIEKPNYNQDDEDSNLDELISERNKVRSKAMLLQLVKKRLAEIEAAKEEKPITQSSPETREIEEEKAPFQNKLNLIDEFLRTAPSISRPEKTVFFDPEVAAQDSLADDGSFVTETLAKIYSGQGNNRKAIEIYQILSLNNPEKSAYFAALIQELENKIN